VSTTEKANETSKSGYSCSIRLRNRGFVLHRLVRARRHLSLGRERTGARRSPGVARRHARRGVYGVGYGAGAAAVGTAAAVAGAPYYYGAGTYPQGGPDYGPGTAANAYYMGYNNFMGYNNYEEYAKRNGIVCRRGTMVKLDDGKMYPCQ